MLGDYEEIQHRITKSYVRIVVTYFVVCLYCVSAVIFSAYLFWNEKYELALGVFSGLATLAAGIAGFWFGSRGSGFPEELPRRRVAPNGEDDVFIGPEIGEDRYGRRFDLDDDASPALDKD